MKPMKWVGWIQHLASKNWHEISRSEDFTRVYNDLCHYVRANGATVKIYILMSNAMPDALPSDYPPPTELRG